MAASVTPLADSALAFASNGHGQHAISIETGISHAKPIHVGDLLIATATERQRGKTLARYDVTVTVQDKPVALFKGTVFYSIKPNGDFPMNAYLIDGIRTPVGSFERCPCPLSELTTWRLT